MKNLIWWLKYYVSYFIPKNNVVTAKSNVITSNGNIITQYSDFIRKNPAYFVATVIYMFISFLLGGFILSFVFYVIAMFFIFSPIGDKFLMVLNNIRPLETRREKEYLIPIFEEVYEQAKAKNPELPEIHICVMDKTIINACAVGSRTVAVTKGAMQNLSEEELKGILGHEIGHIANGDTIASLYMVVGSGFFSFFVLVAKLLMHFVDNLNGIFLNSQFINAILRIIYRLLHYVILVFTFIMQIATSFNSRKAEYRADMYSFSLGFEIEMIEALYLLETISLGDNSTLIQKMTASHPRITARIQRLEMQLDEEDPEE